MDDSSEDWDDIDLESNKKSLREAIINHPGKAWEMLIGDPLMVLAFTSVRRELEDDEVNDNIQQFFEKYQSQVKLIFGKENTIHEYGIAMTAELLTEYWRQATNSTEMSSINEALLKKMAVLIEAVDQLPDNKETKILNRIVNYSTQRIIDFEDYDRLRAREKIKDLDQHLQDLVDSVSEPTEVTKELLALIYFASASTESMEILRNTLAKKLLIRLQDSFEELTESDRFQIAPWISVFEQMMKNND